MSNNHESKKVAIIIPTFNREKVLCDTVESVLQLNPAPDETWVIDQTSQHEPSTEAYLQKAWNRGVKVVQLAEPGVCFARNLGAALSNADILIFIDDDVLIDTVDFVAAHRKVYANPDIHAVWGQIRGPDQDTTDKIENPAQIPQNYASIVEKINYLVSANHSILRNVMLETGGYDEGFAGRTYANEDGDFGHRLYYQGYRIDFEPTASLIHLQAPSGGNRISGRDSFPEWTRSVTFFQFALRHYSGFRKIGGILKVFRTISLRRENVTNPLYSFFAVFSAIYAFGLALKRHRLGLRSSLFDPGVEKLRKEYNATD
ncbi:glycosyltransferase family 2 protein [Thermodesulfobacteriota bacterium]